MPLLRQELQPDGSVHFAIFDVGQFEIVGPADTKVRAILSSYEEQSTHTYARHTHTTHSATGATPDYSTSDARTQALLWALSWISTKERRVIMRDVALQNLAAQSSLDQRRIADEGHPLGTKHASKMKERAGSPATRRSLVWFGCYGENAQIAANTTLVQLSVHVDIGCFEHPYTCSRRQPGRADCDFGGANRDRLQPGHCT